MRICATSTILVLLLAGCGSGNGSSDLGAVSPAAPTPAPASSVLSAGPLLRLTVEFDPVLARFPASTATLSVEVLDARTLAILQRLQVPRSGALSQQIEVTGLQPGELVVRITGLDTSGNPLASEQLSVTLATQDVTLSFSDPSLEAPSPSPSASPSPSPNPPAASPSPSPPPATSPSPSPSPAQPPAATLTVSPVSSSLAILGTQAYQARLGEQDVSSQVTWSVSQSTVAVISPSGVATAVGGGSAQVQASYRGMTAQSILQVSGPALTTLAVAPSALNFNLNQSGQLAAQGGYADGTTRDLSLLVSWSSGSPTTIAVSPNGGVSGLVQGSATVTATLGGLSAQAQVTAQPDPGLAPGPVAPAPSPSPSPVAPVGHSFPLIFGDLHNLRRLDSTGTPVTPDPWVPTNTFTSVDLGQGNFDSSGNFYASDAGGGRLYKVTPAGVATVFASLSDVDCCALDAAGNVFATERPTASGTGKLVKLDPTGTVVTTLVSNLFKPYSVTLDSSGNLYVVGAAANSVSAFRSDGTPLTSFGTNGVVTSASFNLPTGSAMDSAGNLYVANFLAGTVDRIASGGTAVTTVISAGTITNPFGLALDLTGNLYVGDLFQGKIYKLSSGGGLSLFASPGGNIRSLNLSPP